MPQVGQNRFDLLEQRFTDHERAGPAVVDHVLVVGRLEQRVGRDRDGSDLDGTEKTEYELGRVEQQQHDPLFPAHAQVHQRVAGSVGMDEYVVVGVARSVVGVDDGELLAPARSYVRVHEVYGGVHPLG